MLEDQATSKSGKQMPDGSNFSDTKTLTSSMKEESMSKFKATETLKTKMLLLETKTVVSTNSGRSYMLMNLSSNTEKESSTQTSVSMLRESSQSSPRCKVEDTWM
jgi:hypothetical protein